MSDTHDSQSGLNWRVKSAEEIAYRSLCLVAITYRATVEATLLEEPGEKRVLADYNRRLRAWLKDEGVEPHLSPDEAQLLTTLLGKLTKDVVFGMSWRLQSLVVLFWAVGKLATMPTYTRSTTADEVQDQFPIMKPVRPFVIASRLRTELELQRERHRAEFWNWRARTELLRRQGLPLPRGDSFEVAVARALKAALREKLITPTDLRDDDLACGGVPYRDLPDAAFSDVMSTALERHYAMNWVCRDPDWDHVSTDT